MQRDNNLAIGNTVLVGYFFTLFTIDYFNINATLIGVFQELLTLPAMLFMFVFLILSIIQFFKPHKKSNFFKVSTLALFICFILVVSTFVYR